MYIYIISIFFSALTVWFIYKYFSSSAATRAADRAEYFKFRSRRHNGFSLAGVIAVIALILVLFVGYLVLRSGAEVAPVTPIVVETKPDKLLATVSYACEGNSTITAAYYEGESVPATVVGQPPTPGGSVDLLLSGGRTAKLPQTISADGGRYANANETIVFWNKGKGALFTDTNVLTKSCIEVTTDPGGLPLIYASSTKGISLRYPNGYTVNEAYRYKDLGPGKDIAGVSFTIPSSSATGTNLSPDSYVSVEQIPFTDACSAGLFLEQGTTSTVIDGNTAYSFSTSTSAAAGNRYEETVFAIPGSNPCIAVRYFIHYGVFENYASGTVTQFDKQLLLNLFTAIRRTLLVAQ